MTSRERVLMALNHEEADRVPMHDSPWVSTIQRWHQEGLPHDPPAAEYFDFEIVTFSADTTPRFPVKIVEETDEYIVCTTPAGGLRRDRKDYASTPQIVDCPCKNRDDWERIKERLAPDAGRVDWDGAWLRGSAEDERGDDSLLGTGRAEQRIGLPGNKKARAQGKLTCYGCSIGYDKIQGYVASEQLLMAIATDQEWVRDMYETDATLSLQMYEIMKDGGFEFDAAWPFCDLGYRNGLLFSPQHYEETLRPTFQRVFDYFRAEGLPTILHSCGNVEELIPYFIEDGLTCLQPLEVKAGMDLIKLKEQFGDRLTLMGGIDVRAMADPDPSVIEAEIRTKITAAKQGGGYIYHSDHSIPDNVSFDRYTRVLELVRQYGAY